jgi:hypothetical protein
MPTELRRTFRWNRYAAGNRWVPPASGSLACQPCQAIALHGGKPECRREERTKHPDQDRLSRLFDNSAFDVASVNVITDAVAHLQIAVLYESPDGSVFCFNHDQVFVGKGAALNGARNACELAACKGHCNVPVFGLSGKRAICTGWNGLSN